MCRWQVEDGGVEVAHEVPVRHHLFFYQEAFIEAMGTTIATSIQDDAAISQGSASNLKRFKEHHPPTFTGGGDLMVADHWFC